MYCFIKANVFFLQLAVLGKWENVWSVLINIFIRQSRDAVVPPTPGLRLPPLSSVLPNSCRLFPPLPIAASLFTPPNGAPTLFTCKFSQDTCNSPKLSEGRSQSLVQCRQGQLLGMLTAVPVTLLFELSPNFLQLS